MKKILYVIGGMDQGGAESFLMNIVRNIDRSKYDLSIATFLPPRDARAYKYAEELKRRKVKMYRLQDTRFKRPFYFAKQVEQLCRQEQFDIVHSQIDFMSALVLMGARRAGVKARIAHSHNTSNPKLQANLLGRILAAFYKKLLKSCANVRLACGQKAGEFLYGSAKFTVIPNGIELKKFQFSESARQRIRAEFKIGPHEKVLLNVGRVEAQKNQDFLLSLLYLLGENYKLIIVGDGSLREALEKRAAMLNMTERLIITGMREDVASFYAAADIFLLPSHFEGFPTVMIEARASGLPCILSDRISQEVSVLGESEFLDIYSVSATQVWSEKIKQCLIKDAAARRKSGEREAVQNFDVKTSIKLLEQVYDAR